MTHARITTKRYIVELTAEERGQLQAMLGKGKRSARELLRARILLKADQSERGEAWSDSEIATALETSTDTVARTRQRLVEGGIKDALKHHHAPASARPRIFDGAAEAKLIALTRSPPPEGRTRWTLRLLEKTVVEREIVACASDNTIRRTLKKTSSSRI